MASDATFNALLVDTMTITRPDPANLEDDTGTQDDVPTVAVTTAQACLAQVKAPGREFIVGKQSVIADWIIFSLAVPGLAEDCTVVVTQQTGTRSFDVVFVASFNDEDGSFHHLEIFAKEIRG